MKQTVENNQIVFRCLDKAVRYSLLFIQNHISELESELVKFREYERLLQPLAADRLRRSTQAEFPLLGSSQTDESSATNGGG